MPVVAPAIAAYVAFTAVLVLTPGATTAVVIRNTLAGGRRAGLTAALGAALANSSHAAASGLGLALIVARWPSALGLLRLAGGLYLAWLGASSLWRVTRGAGAGALDGQAAGGPPPASFREGLAVNLLNPAIATFYLVVVPSFLPAGAPPWYFVAFAALHVGMAFTCHGVWAFGLDRVRQFFRRPLARKTLEAATGVALIGLAARVLGQI
ncbi:MAG: LysE family translocator [Vicinamibacterales bacterium]